MEVFSVTYKERRLFVRVSDFVDTDPKELIELLDASGEYVGFAPKNELFAISKTTLNVDLVKSCNQPEKKLTGGKVNYYEAVIPYENCKIDKDNQTVVVDAENLINSLNLNWSEGNIMKELFRTANGRNGNGKAGHTEKYGAEKIAYYGNANLENLGRKEELK